MPFFTLEIGVEEIPARFLSSVQKELFDKFSSFLEEANLSYKGLSVLTTPRRFVVQIEEVADVSLEKEEIVIGPSVKAAYDVGYRPTRALEGFAKGHGAELSAIFTHSTEKGDYVAIRKRVGGESALTIFASVCPTIITGLSFPKRMKWGSNPFTFARPLRWILALLGDTVVPFQVGGVTASNTTCGHRVHGTGPFVVPTASEYSTIIQEKGQITLSGEARIALIKEKGNMLAEEKGGKVLWNDALLTEVQGLCEHPVAILGGFDPAYLEVPREVLLTSMESHQKSFGLEDSEGNLLPYFLTVLNITPINMSIVRVGWERVLRARLEDARFFWKNDLEAGFDIWREKLETVVFLAPLGSMADKSRRVAELSGWIANHITYVDDIPHAKADEVIRAGLLCKADLVSEMVNEFDTLQGIMGGIYAEKMGETQIVAQAIAEQYLPSGPDSPVPSTLAGAIVSMADKVDTLVGCFGLGMIPTGATDPYGLRRAALGIIRILLDKKLRVSLDHLFAKALATYGERNWKLDPDQALIRLEEFTSSRLKHYFVGLGAETLFAEAVLQAGSDDPCSAYARLQALTEFSKTDQFTHCAQTFKRVANLIRKQSENEASSVTGAYDKTLLSEAQEIALAEKIEALEAKLSSLWGEENYRELFELIAELRPTVDAFFEGVMVMCEDAAIRENRLNLLQSLLSYFERLADFSALQM